MTIQTIIFAPSGAAVGARELPDGVDVERLPGEHDCTPEQFANWREQRLEDGEITEGSGGDPLPAPTVALTSLQFMDRLPQQRQAEVMGAAMQSPQLMLFMVRLAGAQEVLVDHPDSIAGVHALRDAGVISAAEADALLALPAG